MWRGLCNGTVSVPLSVCLPHLSTSAAACGRLPLWAEGASDIDRQWQSPGTAAAWRTVATGNESVSIQLATVLVPWAGHFQC